LGATRSDLQDYAVYSDYLKTLGGDNGMSRNRLINNLRRAINEELTPRQRQMLFLYFTENIKMADIAEALAVNVSTVSRTIRRGKLRLKKCLRYGAKELLSEEDEY
jgi:RNA polymerase sigma factor (sigma-70 family)